ncbi:MAG: magnesium transporter [Sulfolobales archaeon]
MEIVGVRAPLISLIVLALIEVFAGLLLRFNVDLLVTYPVLLILIPGLMDLRGDVYGAIGYRFTKGLHLGLTQPRLLTRFNLLNIATGYVNSVLISFFLCLIGVGLSVIGRFEMPDIPSLLFIVLSSTVIVFTMLTPTVVTVIAYLFRHGHDPSPFVATIVTGVGDALTPAVLILVAYSYEAFSDVFKLLVITASSGVAVVLLAYMAYAGEGRDLAENFISSTIGSVGSSFGGLFLAMMVGFIAKNPEVLGVLPAFNAVVGAAMGYLSNSLNIDLHIGTESSGRTLYKRIATGFIATYTSVLTALVVVLAFSQNLMRLPIVTLSVTLSCLTLYMVSAIITYLLTIRSFYHGWDPDNIVFPIMTTFVDLMGPITLPTIATILLPE